MLLRCVISAMALLATTPAMSAMLNEDEGAPIKGVVVVVTDQVKDGCLPQPNALKVQAELILRRSGIEVLQNEETGLGPLAFLSPTLQITALGYSFPNSSSCVVSLSSQVFRLRSQLQPEGHSGHILVYEAQKLLGGPKAGMQSRLRETVSQHVSDFANELLKARQSSQ